MEMVRLKCGFENGIEVGAIGSKGGLSLGWKGNFLVCLKSFSSFCIDAEIHDNECGEVWNPDDRGRSASWDLLRQLSHDQTTPWVVLGDFNEITSSFEKKRWSP
ncbi:endonuclease/exonuclease/phosphatase family protein [Gossypium australe]|uniref:Endonuclease/exonuclease/phosphatase family protein n=1 Tax=Gossypium australe TaxID=47621 RepID=A0A5B6VHS8_9ROSI|nr:endonuclease/exonuclease/phosphatase family protein [Gossypium australe]